MDNPIGRGSWAVYEITDGVAAAKALCQQREWPAIEQAGKGRCRLVRGCIPHEAEAERLARGNSGDPPPKPAPRWSGLPKTT